MEGEGGGGESTARCHQPMFTCVMKLLFLTYKNSSKTSLKFFTVPVGGSVGWLVG